jgi:hypothetical protein
VWAASTIAAVLLHGGLLWWGIQGWQRDRQVRLPANIRVLAVTPDEAVAIASEPTSLPPVAPVPPEAIIPVPSETVAPVAPETTPPAAVPPPLADPTTTVAPIEPSTVAPLVPPTETSPPALEPVPPVSDTSQVFRSTPPQPGWSIGESDTAGNPSGRVFATGSLQPVPGGSDLPAQLPGMPPGWETTVAGLIERSGCGAELPPGTTLSVTLWPIVEANGGISEFLSWEGNSETEQAQLANCLVALRPQMPPLLPAMEGGSPIASYAVLLVFNMSVE